MTVTVSPPRPRLAPGVRVNAVGGRLVVVNPAATAFVQSDAGSRAVIDALDGTADPGELEQRFGSDVAGLLSDLAGAGYLVGTTDSTPGGKVVLTRDGIEFSGAHRIIEKFYPLVRPLFTRAGVAFIAVLIAVGAVLLATGRLPVPLAQIRPDATTAITILIIEFALLTLHEIAHAVVLTRHGERVGRVGVGVYWGALCFYVDATAALMLPRRARILQAAAGMISDACLVGVTVTAAVLIAPHPAAAILAQVAISVLLGMLANATPLLQLDGYWMLADVLDRADLHQRARAAVKEYMAGDRSRATTTLAAYAVAGVVVGIAFIVTAACIWLTVIWPLLGVLWTQGLGSQVLALLLAVPTFAPLTVELLRALRRLVRRVASAKEGSATRIGES